MTAIHEPRVGLEPAALRESLLSRDPEAVALDVLHPSEGPRTTGLRATHLRTLLATPEGTLPPVLVHRPTMRVIDGMHRLEVARRRGAETIGVLFFDGDESSAFVLALRANAADGLPLSLADRKRAAAHLVDAHPAWPDRVIARETGLSPATVATLRRQRPRTRPAPAAPGRRVGPDGRIRPVNSEERRRMAGEMLALNPAMSLRQVSRAVGLPPETVRAIQRAMRDRERERERSRQHRKSPETLNTDGIRTRKPQPVGSVAPEAFADLVEHLAADPSLRSSDAGRKVLRLLAMHNLPAEGWEHLAAQVPPHRLDEVRSLAIGCATAWNELAARLAERDDETR
jgi:ParB-like chromosome segregation protein Spo0J